MRKWFRGPLKATLKRIALRILCVLALFWGGGIVLFSFLPVPFSAVMVERQLSAWFSGDFGYVAHSDWVGMDDISPFSRSLGAGF
jgi:monofunctional biosynthetic peptidoglycan transglycosylase